MNGAPVISCEHFTGNVRCTQPAEKKIVMEEAFGARSILWEVYLCGEHFGCLSGFYFRKPKVSDEGIPNWTAFRVEAVGGSMPGGLV
jgi:hypothetical protein